MNNPYNAPQTHVQDHPDEPPKRPALVWIIAIFALFAVLFQIAVTLMEMSGRLPIPNDALRAYLHSQTPLDHLLLLIALILFALGALYLFRLKKAAVNILVINALYKAGASAYFFTKPLYRAYMVSMDPARSISGYIVSWILVLAIIAYAFKLRRDKVLR